MKKTLKLVGIFAGSLLAVIVVALSTYFLIQKYKTYHIYDVRLVVPVEDAGTYIYMNAERDYVSMKNQKVYLTTESENYLPLAIFASTSNKSKNVKIESSDPTVAQVLYKEGLCYVKYLKAGSATITGSIGGVEDSFDIEVYDKITDDFNVYDYVYYGDYAEYFSNKIIGYADSYAYSYDYKVYSSSGKDSEDMLNNDLLRIDYTTVNTEVFENVAIDPVKRTLIVECKDTITTNIDEQFVVQSYAYDTEGVIRVYDNYVVNVHIISYIPEFLQIMVSNTPDFEKGYAFMNTSVIDDSSLTIDAILEDPDILDEYLSYMKAEHNLVALNEDAVYKTMFTQDVTKIYLKFRKVYTNGDVVYLNPAETAEHFELVANSTYLKLSPTEDFYVLELDPSYFSSNTSFDVSLSLNVSNQEYTFDLSHVFKFEYVETTFENIDEFYSYDSETGVYTYDYWDPRARYDGEIYNEKGEVIGFYE